MRHTITPKKITSFFALLVIGIGLCAHAALAIDIPEDQAKAVILAYHRVGEDAYPDTNLSTEQFDQHLGIMLGENYNILPLQDIIQAWNNNTPLPPNTIAITFEGAYRSSYHNAMVKLLDHNIPFTVFYSAGSTPASSQQSAQLDWKTLKALSKRKNVSLGILPATYARHQNKPENEIRNQVNKAIKIHQDNFGTPPKFFSYPFGELSKTYRSIIEENKSFLGAVALNSSVAYKDSPRFALPRFAMTDPYGSPERFLLVTKALPLPATNLSIQPNLVTFQTAEALNGALDTLSCFVSGQDKPQTTHQDNHIQIIPAEPITSDRARINCTINETQDKSERWRWLGLLLTQ